MSKNGEYYTLKQHTPLLHFQHDQEGATLRASEVKPLLDKFIINKKGNGIFEEGINALEDVMICKEKSTALNYKMRIVESTNANKTEYLVASYINKKNIEELTNAGINVLNNTPYFAQEKQNSEVIHHSRKYDSINCKALFSENNIYIKIICHSEKLTDLIGTYIQSFFLSTNFGTRSSKGFGCFTVTCIKKDGKDIPLEKDEKLLASLFKFTYRREGKFSIQEIFETINKDYKILKSGLNKPYIKSKLMCFEYDNNIRWEKKWLKKKIDNKFENAEGENYKLKDNNKQEDYDNSGDFKFVRAIMGLSEQYEFLLENPPEGKEKNKMIIKIKDSSSDKDKRIERFQSPITYKIINGIIYVVGNDIDERILDKEFNFYLTVQGDDEDGVGWKDYEIGSLKTPREFNLGDFLKESLGKNYLFISK